MEDVYGILCQEVCKVCEKIGADDTYVLKKLEKNRNNNIGSMVNMDVKYLKGFKYSFERVKEFYS